MNAEYAYLPQRRMVDGLLIQDDSFGRLDVAPSVRVPLSRLSFLSLNTSATYRTTYYTRQARLIAPTQPGSYFRQYATVRTEMVGPVLTRIFDLPESSFAERIKHVIEPSVTMDFTSPIADYRRTPILSDISDFIVGDSTRGDVRPDQPPLLAQQDGRDRVAARHASSSRWACSRRTTRSPRPAVTTAAT